MARGFSDLIAAAFGAGREAAQRCALLDVNGFHLQLIDVGAVVVLGVGDGGLQNFF